MSSQNPSASETAPLLDSGARPASGLFKWSPETLFIPVAIATRLACQIHMTTLVEFVRLTVCRLWKAWHPDDPAASLPPDVCDVPAIERSFSTVLAVYGTVECILTIVVCGVLSHTSSRYGRKPALLALLVVGLVGACLISVSRHTSPDSSIADWIFLVGSILEMVSNPILYAFLGNMYIVDVCVAENRTAALNRITGWTTLGICISFGLGGLMTTKTGNPLIVFYTSAALCVTTIFYVAFVLPESFPKKKRNALSHLRPESSAPDSLLSTNFLFFKPLAILVPAPRVDGTHNWRLAWCAMHSFIFMSANAYVSTAWVVLATSKYHLTPAGTGLFLSIITISGTILLTGIVPPLIRFLRPYYSRKIAEDVAREASAMETSDRLDVHLAVISCIITGVSYVSAAASTTNSTLILSAILVGMSYVHSPTLRSLVAGSVDPLKQGEALAAFEIVSNMGACLSPVIMGTLVTVTISTAPLLPFYVHLVVALVSSPLLFLVRDVDRYRPSDVGDAVAVR